MISGKIERHITLAGMAHRRLGAVGNSYARRSGPSVQPPEVDVDIRSALRRLLHAGLSLLASGESFADARAAVCALHVHRHTFEYRLQRLAESTGQDLADPVVRLRCQLALITLRMWPHRAPWPGFLDRRGVVGD